jgi:hypothetical protein
LLRTVNNLDLPTLTNWIARDADHSARGVTADFFQQPISFAIDDDKGPIMYVRLEPMDSEIIRLHIQFDEGERRRTAVALARHFPQVRDLIAQSGCRYIVFDSVSETLVRFCQKHFGFINLPDTSDYFLDIKAGN